MNTEFVGAVVFSPAIPNPQIVSTSLVPSIIEAGKQGTLNVSVKNNGDTGEIRVSVSSEGGRASITPFFDNKEINGGSTSSFAFTVNAGSTEGLDNLFVFAEGVGTGLNDSKLVVLQITAPTTPECGDGFCQGLENPLTCPADCDLTPTHLECSALRACVVVEGAGDNTCSIDADCGVIVPVVCAPWEKKILTSEPIFLIDLFGLKLFQIGETTPEPSCVLNYNLIIVGALAIVVVAVAIRVMRK